MWDQSRKEGTATATWFKTWDLVEQHENPPNSGRIPNNLEFFRHYALDMAHIVPSGPDETPRHFKLRLYNILQQMAAAEKEALGMRVVQKRPTVNWDRVWRNLHTNTVSEIKSAWYSVIQDIIPTNVRLAAIHLVDTGARRQCEKPDTVTHRLNECAVETAIWNWTKHWIAMMIRTDLMNVSTE